MNYLERKGNLENNEEPESISPSPWGLWATLGFSFIILFAYVATQTGLTIGYVIYEYIPVTANEVEKLISNGNLISICTSLSSIVCVSLILLFVGIRKNISVKEYLSIRNVSAKTWGIWIGIILIFIVISDSLTYLIGKPIVLEFMVSAYTTVKFLPFLYLTLIIIAPINEELFFRGFLFEGIRKSRLGGYAAIGITSLVWSAIHLQYNLYGIITIFIVGLIMGLCRLKTDSILVPIGMHMLGNFIATIEAEIYTRYFM